MTEGEVGKRCVLFTDQLGFYFCMLAGFLTDLMMLFLNELGCMYTDL